MILRTACPVGWVELQLPKGYFRGIFGLVLALGVFCGFLITMTQIVQEPGGFSLGFRWVVCAGLTAGFLALFGVDLYGIWTGHLPGQDNNNEHTETGL